MNVKTQVANIIQNHLYQAQASIAYYDQRIILLDDLPERDSLIDHRTKIQDRTYYLTDLLQQVSQIEEESK